MADSILQTEKECYITGQTNNLHKHHIFFGNPLRQISEDNGFWVYLAGGWLTDRKVRDESIQRF